MSRRRRGRYEDGDVRYLAEQNKRLKRKLSSLLRENGRIKKERDRWKGQAEEQDNGQEAVEQPAAPPVAPELPAPGLTCPHCGSSDVTTFKLEIRGAVSKYVTCFNTTCRRRSRLKDE